MLALSALLLMFSEGVSALSQQTNFPAGKDLSTLHHQSWSTGEGLPQSSVQNLFQTHDGFLWAGTEGGGVVRFDGISMKTYGPPSDMAFRSGDVGSFAEGAGGVLWAGTTEGLVALHAGRADALPPSSGISPSATILSLLVRPDGGLLVLTSDGLFQSEPGGTSDAVRTTFSRLAVDASSILALQRGRAGRTLVISRNGIFELRGTTLEPVAIPPVGGSVLGVAEGPNDRLWFRTATSVAFLDGAGAQRVWKTEPGPENLPGTRVLSLTLDRAGTAWVGTNRGLVALQADSARPVILPALAGESVLSTLEDAEGNEWVGTESTGLNILRRLKFHEEAAVAGLTLTAAVVASDGALWVGTRADGVRRVPAGLHGDAHPVSSISGALTSPVVLSLAPDRAGGIWVGTPDGLNHVSANGEVEQITAADGLPDDFIRSLAVDSDGSVWAGTRHGLAHLLAAGAKRAITTLTRADGLPSDLIGPLLRGSGASAGLWIGTSAGLAHLRDDGSFERPSPGTTFPSEVITALAEDADHTIWVAARGGALSRWTNGGLGTIAAFHQGEISGLAADAGGSLWIRTSKDVLRVSRAPLSHCAGADASCPLLEQAFGTADGLPSEELTTGTTQGLALTAEGMLLVPTRHGLGIADPARLPVNTTPPPVVLERVLLDDTPILFSSASELSLPYSHSRLTVDYAGLSFTAPSRVRYRVLLEGFDRGWTEAGARRSATYTNLPPGRYRFRVLACNEDGVWNEVGATLALRIVPPFYRRVWFAVLMLLLVAGLVLLLYQMRLRQVRLRFQAVLAERNRMAREIHDTLAQDFVGVSLELDLIGRLLGKGKAEDALANVARTRTRVIEGLAEARRSIWQLRANTAEDSLPSRLDRTMTHSRADGTKVRLSMGGAYRPLPPATEDEVLRIAQEAVSNVERHAGATTIEVALHYGEGLLTLCVKDDGKGFVSAAAEPVGHYGLRGMRERAALLNGELRILSAPGVGTEVLLSVPITQPRRSKEQEIEEES